MGEPARSHFTVCSDLLRNASSPLRRAGAGNPSGEPLAASSRGIITHQQPPLDPLVRLAEGRGIVFRGLAAGFVPLCGTKQEVDLDS